jgi:hypothetical protein
MNYLHTVRFCETAPPEGWAEVSEDGHYPVELRVWISLRPENRWVEVDCLCGSIGRAAGLEPYGDLARAAWDSICSATRPLGV